MIGIVWVNHHVLVKSITAVDRTLLFLNLVLLLFVVLIPFATATMAEYLRVGGSDSHLAAALYAFTQAWNEFLYALVFITNVRLRTLPVGLSTFITGDVYGWGYLMAGAVLTTLELLHDPDLHKRGMMQKIEHPVRGPVIVPGWPLRMSDSKVPLKCAPILGADCEAIYGEWLGCSPDEVRDMRQGKVI